MNLFPILVFILCTGLISYILAGMIAIATYNRKYKDKLGRYRCKSCNKIPYRIFWKDKWWGRIYYCNECFKKGLDRH